LTPDAIQGLYRTHAFAVLRRCRQLLRDDDEARDAMHEVFLKVLEDPARFRGRSSPATYLFGIATNLCMNRLRNRAVRGAEWQASVALSLASGRPGAADAAEARQLAAAVLAEADPETATMALYHFVDGLSQGEIASLVGRSRVTVNQRLQRFRADARRRSEET
jgi:RNA polymerase sigma-70 factor (ECF subfamily)